MHKCLLVIALIVVTNAVMSQSLLNGGLAEAYRDFSVAQASQRNRIPLEDFAKEGGDKRFFNNKWCPGVAVNNYGNEISTGYTFNFDFQKHELYAKWKDTAIVVNSNYLNSFTLVYDGFTHYFFKDINIDAPRQIFMESIGFDPTIADPSRIQIFQYRVSKQLRANKNDYLANFNGDYSDQFDNELSYYLRDANGSLTKIKMTKKGLYAALPAQKAKLDGFFAEYKGALDFNGIYMLVQSLNAK